MSGIVSDARRPPSFLPAGLARPSAAHDGDPASTPKRPRFGGHGFVNRGQSLQRPGENPLPCGSRHRRYLPFLREDPPDAGRPFAWHPSHSSPPRFPRICSTAAIAPISCCPVPARLVRECFRDPWTTAFPQTKKSDSFLTRAPASRQFAVELPRCGRTTGARSKGMIDRAGVVLRSFVSGVAADKLVLSMLVSFSGLPEREPDTQ